MARKSHGIGTCRERKKGTTTTEAEWPYVISFPPDSPAFGVPVMGGRMHRSREWLFCHSGGIETHSCVLGRLGPSVARNESARSQTSAVVRAHDP